MKRLDIYTDGACSHNGTEDAVGGWAIVVTNGTKQKSFSGGELNTTNNKMELMAVVKALEYFHKNMSIDKEKFGLRIFCDSAYVVNGINQRWIKKWINNGWLTSKKTPVENQDLWKKINEFDKLIDFQIIKVKGHDGNALNEKSDMLAVAEVNRLKELNNIK